MRPAECVARGGIMISKTLDAKLGRILADPTCGDFILADAKDADMAFGLAAPGRQGDRLRTLAEFRELIRRNVAQGLVDVMLMSVSTSDLLALGERIFDDSSVTPAIRANDTTDIWLASGGSYPSHPSRPFRTASIDHAMCGKVDCQPHERGAGVNLGLYSITLNNCPDRDVATLDAYRAFREEAERKGFGHFLEVFNPNSPVRPIADVARFVNDSIARVLAGVAAKGRPLFLKIPYNGPAAMEQLVGYDPSLVVGILGGSSGTTYDAFHQLWEAKKYGARAALYGRMINQSEDQPTFIQHLRWLADGELTDPRDAVRSYHNELAKRGVAAHRSRDADLQSATRHSAYSQR